MSNPQFSIKFTNLPAKQVMHLLPEGADQIEVSIENCHSLNSGWVRILYRGRKADGTPHQRRTAKEFGMNEDWFFALLIRDNLNNAAQMRSMQSTLDTELQDRLKTADAAREAARARTRAEWDALTPEQQAEETARREAKYEAQKREWEAEQAALAASANEIQSAAAGQPGLQA